MKRALHLIWLRVSRTWLVMLALAATATVFAGLWWQFDVMEISDDERGAYDDGMKAFTLPKRAVLQFVQKEFGLGKPKLSDDVLIVALDNDTMKEVAGSDFMAGRYGRALPFDRIIWSDLVTYLSKMGVRGIVFDMVFNEPTSNGLGDKAFSDTLKDVKVPVVLGFDATVGAALPKVDKPTLARPIGPMPTFQKEVGPDEFPEDPTPEEAAEIAKKLAAARLEWAARCYSAPMDFGGGLEAQTFPTIAERVNGEPTGKDLAQNPIAAIPPLLETVDGFGSVGSEEDEDGKLRRTAFAFTDGQNTYPTLPVMLFAQLEHAESISLEPGHLTIGERKVRINQDGSAEIHYGGRLDDRFRVVTLSTVVSRYLRCTNEDESKRPKECAGDLSKDPEGSFFKGKIVVVGGTATGMGDSKATPLDQSTPGLIKQAAIIDNLLHDEFIIAAPFWASLLFAFAVSLFSVALVLVVRNTFVDIGWPVLLYVGFFIVTGGFLVATRIHVLSALPGLAGTVASILATTWERLFARKERERMKELFQNYMEADLVDLMVEQKKLPSLEGENLNVTAFFSDIKGFSTFSEKLKDEPKRLMSLLNRYLSTVTPELTEEGACIDKYIGDAVVALFGAPVPHHDHALRACKGALRVQKALGKLREELRREGLPDVYTRVGLNTGQMMVGNIGSAQLLDYTAIGDEMNLAARLEGANKNYGTLIMMGEGTYLAVRNQVETRELDLVRVAGKTQAARVYELLSLRGELPAEKRKVVDLYGQALLAYRGRKFTEAKQVLAAALAVDESDGPSRRLLALCTEFEVHPPPPQWDGVSTLEK
ncbi:MAG: adenylate/guanylate cyclase domain-containing protein [Myxococcaceae bacterium]